MAKKDIYKIDNYFITIGAVFLIFSLVTIFLDPRTYYEVSIRKDDGEVAGGGKQENYTFENKYGRSLDQIRKDTNADEVTELGFPWVRTIIGVNGLVLLTIGIIYRKRENKIIAIWNALDRTGEAKLDELATSLGLDRNFITQHLKDINAQQATYYIWDKAKDKIIDGKLKTEFLIIVDCKSCGSKVDEKVSFDLLTPPTCEYCGNPLATSEDLNQLKKDLMATTEVVAAAVSKEFNVAVFVVLLVVFWPGAIFYVIKQKS